MDCMRVNTRVLVRKKERSKLRGINPPANERRLARLPRAEQEEPIEA